MLKELFRNQWIIIYKSNFSSTNTIIVSSALNFINPVESALTIYKNDSLDV